MKTLHRLYSWIMFPVIATLHIIGITYCLIFNLINNFTLGRFYEKEIPTGFPFDHVPEYPMRMIMALCDAIGDFWQGMKGLNTYKF